jgi:2-polyprenyl-6-methoxyphenol hydroxylase-like FAD-dependent oxidoreductase
VRTRSVVVLGGGVAGLVSALLLARDGQPVVLVERDPMEDGPADEAMSWPRRGVPHFQLPHAFIPRGRLELLRLVPDVYNAMLEAGGHDVDCRPKLPGAPQPGDDELQYLAVRRPLVEWALRRAVSEEPRITTRVSAPVDGIEVAGGRVGGVSVGGATLDAEVVVDAMGRRSPTPRWLATCGVDVGEPRTSDCGVVYYARYYRQRPGFELPDGPWVLSPRADLGYCAYATFPGDNGAFAALLAVPKGVPQWRGLNDPSTYEAAVARIPVLSSWVDPAGCDPLTGVMPMAGLRNGLRPREATVPGLFAVGDALGHTDPVLAHGLAFGLIHAGALRDSLRAHDDVGDAGAAYAEETGPALQERFDFVTALDDQRLRLWLGEPVDFAHRDGDYAMFSMAAAGAAALVDGDVARVFVRRLGLLDSTAVLDTDAAMQQRIEDIFATMTASPGAPAGPSREEMLAVVAG